MRPTAHVEKRDIPNMHETKEALQGDSNYFSKNVFGLMPNMDNRRPGTMPTQREKSILSKHGKRWVEALVLQERLVLKLNDLVEQRSTDISTLIMDATYMQCCVNLIQICVLTDFQMHFKKFLLLSFPQPQCAGEVLPSLDWRKESRGSLKNVSAKQWIVLLAVAMRNHHLVDARFHQHILRTVHELHYQLSSINWSEIKNYPITKSLDEKYWRFALALLGARKARQIYRIPSKMREFCPSDEKISSGFLLDDVEAFSREMIKFKPKSALGYWFLAWVMEQGPTVRKIHGLAAAADALKWYKKAYEVADAEGNDLVSACARIDGGYCILVGGAGVVKGGHNAVVRRCFESENNEKSKKGRQCSVTKAYPMDIKCCTDMAHLQRVMKYEQERLAKNVPGILLEKGSYCLVEWWEILHMWNAAMKKYDKMENMKMGYQVYGESGAWDYIAERLHHFTAVQRLNLEEEQYANSPLTPGIQPLRDLGREGCAKCGAEENSETPLKTCSRCKRVSYCSRECQKEDWKHHKASCIKCTK